MKKLSLISLSVIALFMLSGCGCKKKTEASKPEVTLEHKKNKKQDKKNHHTSDKNCKSCTKDYKQETANKRHAYIELDEAEDILI